MKRPYLVGLKCRELMGKHYAAYREEKLAVKCQNCVYNQKLTLPNGSSVRICTAAYIPGTAVPGGLVGHPGDPDTSRGTAIRTCDRDDQAKACPAYTPVYRSAEEVAAAFRVEVQDPEWKRRKYPDIVALEWVLDNDYHKATQKPKWWVRGVLWVISILERVVAWTGGDKTLLSWEKQKSKGGTSDA